MVLTHDRVKVARRFLEQLLDEPVPARTVLGRAAAAGITEHHARLAADELGVVKERVRGRVGERQALVGAHWYWRLP